MTTTALARGRDAFARQDWAEARARLAAADAEEPLTGEDLFRLGVAAYLVGRDEERDEVMERAHRAFLEEGDRERAARCAFWLGMGLMDRGEAARGSGWLARAHRLVEDRPDSAESGFLQIPVGLRCLGEGDADGALAAFQAAADVAARTGEPDLTALARLGLGQSRIVRGDVEDGLTLLDEVMVAVEAGEVSPIPAGIIYCAVISACQRVHDVQRAQEWTDALTAWCEAQPDLVPFRGQCLIHRTELLVLHGDWARATTEAQRAVERLSDPPGQPSIGAAVYQRAELHRLRGEFDAAEEAYRIANRWGHTPQPGLAQLRLAQGRTDAARGAIRRVLDETDEPSIRARLLAVQAEIALATDDLDLATESATELTGIATTLGVSLLDAVANHVRGAVLLARGESAEALGALRAATEGWRALEAPFEEARARVLVGLAYRELGDRDTADLELDAARTTFRDLGAEPELSRLDELVGNGRSGPLSPREVEVLRLVAAGRTNRAIAEELVISEHTVARHVQNIFGKLDVSSRTAAAAYAFEHDLA